MTNQATTTNPLRVSSPGAATLTAHTNPRLAAAAVAIRANDELMGQLIDALVTDVAVLGAKPEWEIDDNCEFTAFYVDKLIHSLRFAGVTLRDALSTGNLTVTQILTNPHYTEDGQLSHETEELLDQLVDTH